MSCLGQLRARCQPYMNAIFRQLRPEHSNVQMDKNREEIVRNVVSLVLAHIDRSYKPDPVLIQHTKMEIEKYIDIKVTQRFTEQVEMHGLQQKFNAIAKENLAKAHAILEAGKVTGLKSDVYSAISLKEMPAVEESVDNLSVSADSVKVLKKKKSFLKKVFKHLPKRSKKDTKNAAEKKPSFVRRIVHKIPIV